MRFAVHCEKTFTLFFLDSIDRAFSLIAWTARSRARLSNGQLSEPRPQGSGLR